MVSYRDKDKDLDFNMPIMLTDLNKLMMYLEIDLN